MLVQSHALGARRLTRVRHARLLAGCASLAVAGKKPADDQGEVAVTQQLNHLVNRLVDKPDPGKVVQMHEHEAVTIMLLVPKGGCEVDPIVRQPGPLVKV